MDDLEHLEESGQVSGGVTRNGQPTLWYQPPKDRHAPVDEVSAMLIGRISEVGLAILRRRFERFAVLRVEAAW